MKETKKRMILTDCKIMLNKYGDIQIDKSYQLFKDELWQIGNRYGITGIEVLKIMMDNFDELRRDDNE